MKKIISWEDFVVEKSDKPKYSKEKLEEIKKKAKPLKKEDKEKIVEDFDDVNIKDMMKRGYHSADVKKKKNSDETSSKPDYPRPWVELPSEECENCDGTGIDEDNDTCGLCGGTGNKNN